MKPEVIIGGDVGFHNRGIRRSRKRVVEAKVYENAATVAVIPTRGAIPARVVESWMNLIVPMNQRFMRMFISGMEVGAAYEYAVDLILGAPELNDFRYMLTMEEDNLPPPDGLLSLLNSIDKYAAVGGLYWTKGEGGQPMIYGDPNDLLLNFRPQPPHPGRVQECNGLGMGFTLFDLSLFREGRIERPFFKTVQDYDPASGASLGTQDLYFFGKARKAGYKVASDNRVKVGHLDPGTGIVW